MKTRKLTALALALAVCLTACGEKDSPAETVGGSVPSEPPVQTGAAAEAAAGVRIDALAGDKLLVDDPALKITASGLREDFSSVTLALTLENTGEADLTVDLERCSANGYMLPGAYLFRDLPAGAKAEEELALYQDELALLGVDALTDLELAFLVTGPDYETYLQTGPISLAADPPAVYEDTYQTTVTDAGALAALGLEQTYFTTEPLFDSAGVKLASLALVKSEGGSADHLFLELENHGEQLVRLTAGDLAVNGLSFSASLANADLDPGRRAVLDINLTAAMTPAFWQLYGLGEIGQVAFTLEAADDQFQTVAEAAPVCVTVRPGGSFDATGTELYNENGLRFVLKGVAQDPAGYLNYAHVLLLMENAGQTPVSADCLSEPAVTVNGEALPDCFGSAAVPAGGSAVLDVHLPLEGTGLALADLETIQLNLTVTTDGGVTTLAQPTLTIQP